MRLLVSLVVIVIVVVVIRDDDDDDDDDHKVSQPAGLVGRAQATLAVLCLRMQRDASFCA